MSELLGRLQTQTFERSTIATATSYPPQRRLSAARLVQGDWVTTWIRLGAERLLSYAAESAVL
jgi:hypothetical protein